MNFTDELRTLSPSLRCGTLGFSDIVTIRNRVIALQQSGTDVIRLEGGEPFMPTPERIKTAMKEALDRNETRYAPSSGVPQLLDAIARKATKKNGLAIGPTQAIVTSGGMHGLFCAFQATLDPGDEVIFFSPYWTPIRDLVSFCGATAVRIPWDEVRAGALAEGLRRRITARTRVIYVNSPANPTGDVFTLDELEVIAAIAREANLVVISDEAYEDLTWDGVRHRSIGSLPGMFERTISVFTLSKSYSMTGWRIGYLVASEAWMEVLRKLVLNSVNGVSTPTQWAGVAALSEPEETLAAMRTEYLVRRNLLLEALTAHGFSCHRPRGAFYLFVDVRTRLGPDSWKAMDRLLSTTGIATVPGAVFGEEGEGHLRMSFSAPMAVIEKAAAALARID